MTRPSTHVGSCSCVHTNTYMHTLHTNTKLYTDAWLHDILCYHQASWHGLDIFPAPHVWLHLSVTSAWKALMFAQQYLERMASAPVRGPVRNLQPHCNPGWRKCFRLCLRFLSSCRAWPSWEKEWGCVWVFLTLSEKSAAQWFDIPHQRLGFMGSSRKNQSKQISNQFRLFT